MSTPGATILPGVASSAIAMAVTYALDNGSGRRKGGVRPGRGEPGGRLPRRRVLLGVLGILAVSGEHATGTIRATLAAEPRRPMVFAAKVLVFAAVTTFASFLLGQAFLTWPAGTPRCPVPGRCGPGAVVACRREVVAGGWVRVHDNFVGPARYCW